MKKTCLGVALFGLAFALVLAGCQKPGDGPSPGAKSDAGATADPGEAATSGQEAEIRSARAALSPEDQQLVEAQDFCAVMTDHRLGVMGTPVKVMVKDQPVFLCCKGCQRKALADPDKTLAQVEELLARKREVSPAPSPSR